MVQLSDFFSEKPIDDTPTPLDIEAEIAQVSENDYPLSRLTEKEWKSFAIYTTENRAIANISDGLKPVQRFYLYSSIINTKTAFEKVSAVAGVISKYGYNHGETSAAGAGQLMAADWNNNLPLVRGRGSFGSRLVQMAGAPRYTYTKLHENFSKYIKDIDISPVHADPEHAPPAFYVPVIPLVLANGIKGIATGFATHILPRDPADLKKSCIEFVKTGKLTKRPALKFPEFSGTSWYVEAENRFYWRGTFERKSKTVIIITEIPYGYDRIEYVEILNKMEDDEKIVSYEELSDKTGFRFEVKLKQNISANWTDEEIYREFKLQKVATENITVIDFDGKLKEYDNEMDLIKDFCVFRLGILQQRIDKFKREIGEELRWLNIKLEFVKAVLDDKITFKGMGKDGVSAQILAETSALKDDCERLLRISIVSLTTEMITELEREISQNEKNLSDWENTTKEKQFLLDLSNI